MAKHALNSRSGLGCSRIHENWSCGYNTTLPDTGHRQSALRFALPNRWQRYLSHIP